MAEFNEKELKSHIKSKDFLPAYLIIGDEDYLKKLYCDKLIEAVVDANFESFNLDRFEGKSADLRKIFDTCEMLPMMSDKRCVVVEDFKLDSLKDSDFELLKSFFINLPDFTVLIFYQKSDFSVTKAKKVTELFKSYGALCKLDKRTGKELTKPLIASASKHGCILNEDSANYLVSVCGDDFNILTNELAKLCNYVSGGEITRKHIDELATKTDDAKIYFLTKALLSKNFDKAYETLSSLIRQKTEPEYILGTLISTYVDIYRAKISLNCSENAEALSSDYGYGKTAFRLSNAARDSRGMDIATIRKCLDELYIADRQLKFTRDSATVIFEQLMVKLFLIANGERV